MLNGVNDILHIIGSGVMHYNWPSSLGTISATLWYPAYAGSGTVKRYRDILHAKSEENAIPMGTNWPLIIISHGSCGSRFDQSYLAEFLSTQGFAVLAVDHQDIQDAQYRWMNLTTRPQRLVYAYNELLLETLGERINFSRLLVIGHSAGAYDALVMCGCQPCFELEPEFSSVLDELSCFAVEQCLLKDICAVILLAPALSNLFLANTLNEMLLPTLILSGERDTMKLLGSPTDYATHLPHAKHHILFGAGHYAFVYEFSPLLKALNSIVSGGDYVPRKELHYKIMNYISAFITPFSTGETISLPRKLIHV
ncbi:alpha/beta hydrolase family protein [Photorhabdus luminescens]|uniref:Alpha/beta hydrolase n=2 Tax=Photorhabdus luminescens TaxID=29488 RepID=A0A5C4REK6_PHOLU|nr:alpha/beta hydrolase [Photorhabdus luminescens]TNH42412.1 alpha/beta hydrolase [Photorhabdus luminescens subsp. sonorensis]